MKSFGVGSERGGNDLYRGLVIDSAGNLYGVTESGGANAGGASGLGVIYKLTEGSAGWTETVMHNFTGRADGATPYATPILDATGNLHGATNFGDAANLGTVYRLSPKSCGAWTLRVLHSFAGGSDGASPLTAGVIFDQQDNLYGATSGGGTAGYGIAYELTPTPSGPWTETILYTFLAVLAQDPSYPNGLISLR